MNRRGYITAMLASISMVGFSGCNAVTQDEEDITVSDVCEGDCDTIESINVDSHSGLDAYTDVAISFSEAVSSVRLTVKTFDDENVVNGVKDIEGENTTGIQASFDDYKTDELKQVSVYVHTIEMES